MGRDGEGDKKEVKGWKGRGKDLPDQCQTASYVAMWLCSSSSRSCNHVFINILRISRAIVSSLTGHIVWKN